MTQNELQIKISAQDDASKIINLVGTAFEAAANDIANMVAKTNLAKVAMDTLNTNVKAAADGVSAAFKTLDIRKGLDIEQDKQKLLAAFKEIKQSGTATPEEINRAFAALKNGLGQLNAEAKTQMAGVAKTSKDASALLSQNMEQTAINSSKSLKSMFDLIGSAALRFNSIVGLVKSFGSTLMSLAEPAMMMDKLNTQFKAASGSAQTAARDLQFVRGISASLGLSFTESATGFAKFSASVRGTSIEGEQARKVFTGVAEASTALRLSADETNGILTKHQQDRRKLGELYYQDVNKMRDDDQKKERAAYDARLNDHRDYLQALGKAEEADNFEFARKLQRERDNLLEHFARKEADAKANGLVLVGLESEKQAAIEELQKKQHAAAERRGLERVQRDIEAAKKAADAQIAEIKRKEAAGILSAQHAAAEILLIEQDLLKQQLELAKNRANTWTPDTEQHKKALGEIAAAEAALTNNLAAQARQREAARKESYNERIENLKLAMQGELLAVQEGETAKSISAQEGAKRRLEIERDYAEQMAALRAQEVDRLRERSETDTKEYQAALSARLEADKAYLTAKQKLNEYEAKQFAQLTERAAEEIRARVEQERAALAQSAEFAAGWFSIWDAAYSRATRSLQALSVAAYNSFAEMQDMPLKSIDTLENLRKKADEAAREFGRLHEQSRLTALTSSAVWSQAYSDLIKVSASAAKITEEFYRQAVAAEELAEALELPVNSTEQFVWQAENALKQMKLLDNSSLDKLRAGIKRIKDEMAAFTERVIDGLKSLQDEWDNMTMSKMQLEEKRYQEQRLEWQKDYDNAQKQGNAQALAMLNEQLKLIEKIHKAKSAELSLDPDNSIAPIKRALGGWVPGTGNADTVPAMLTPGEYVIRQSASNFRGNGILTAINNPFSKWGQELQARIAGISAALPQTPLTPRLAFATGGPVAPVAVTSAQAPISLVINTTEQIDADLIRRKIIPELERYQRRTK